MPATTTPQSQQPEAALAVAQVLAVIARLRDPIHGCPWDLRQTHQSLKPYLLEESYETLEAIDQGSSSALKEELGDVLLQVLLHAQLASDAGQFDFNKVCIGLVDKLIRRHPHVFGSAEADSAEQVTQSWQAIKAVEKADTAKTQSVLDGVNASAPALSRALATSCKAVAVGFTWPDLTSLWQCVMSEFDEFRVVAETEVSSEQQRALEDEFGDILFATVNLGRHYHIDPEVALSRAITKFRKRFHQMERTAHKPLTDLSFTEWNDLWNQAKAQS